MSHLPPLHLVTDHGEIERELHATPVYSDINDRRSHRRFTVSRPGKVFRRTSQQYVPVSSRDLSFGGALLEIESDRGFGVGEILDIGLSLKNTAVVASASLIPGMVVRSFAVGEHRQLIAVRYLQREAIAKAA